jgi:hypothetical protein
MDNKSYTIRVPKRWGRIAAIVGVLALIVAPLTAVATHSFDDVSNDNTFHEDIEWLKAADVTRGCNPPDNNLFCPDDNVTREQMSAFMKRLAENQVVDAATAITAGTAYEAINDSVSLSGTSSGTADSIATLNDLPAGAYVVTASWHATAHGAGASARIICDISAASASSRVIAQVDNAASGQESLAGVLTGNLSPGDAINLSCWRENQVGSQSIGNAHLIAYPVTDFVSNEVSE